MSRSLFDNEKRCFVCLSRKNIHKHHVYGGANRDKSERTGEWVYLCAHHHNMSDDGVHFNKALDDKLKKYGQKRFEQEVGDRIEFMKIFGRNYLEADDDV